MMIESFQLDRCRGVEATVTDTSSNVALVKASVASVSDALAQLNSQVQIYSNVYGQSIQAKGEGLVVFQFCGFDWTLIEDRRLNLNSAPIEEILSQLSRFLNTRSIYYVTTDTVPYLYHRVWDSGETVEIFLFDDEDGEPKVRQSESQIREDAFKVPFKDFYAAQGIYLPKVYISPEPFEGNSTNTFAIEARFHIFDCLKEQSIQLTPGRSNSYEPVLFEESDFEQFDYITFGE